MQAYNRLLKDWFTRVRTGQIILPRFQRFEAWGDGQVKAAIQAVLRGQPIGAVLVMQIGDKEMFQARRIAGTPDPTSRPNEYLLDGQQRLTALWRAFTDSYDEFIYLVRFEPDVGSPNAAQLPVVDSYRKYTKDGRKFPLWAYDPPTVWKRGYIPLRLFRPEDIGAEIPQWCREAADGDLEVTGELSQTIYEFRDRSINACNLPYLSLPAETKRAEALHVFVQMNTNYSALTAFDILVAQTEGLGQSLHDLVRHLRDRVPSVEAYMAPSDLALNTATLRQDRPPTQAGYYALDLKTLVSEWDHLVEGIAWAVGFLEEESVLDGDRLPTAAVLPVLAAVYEHVPTSLDSHGNARATVRKYVWRSFFTDRYGNAAATRALQDYRGLRDQLNGREGVVPPVLDETLHPLPDLEDLVQASWPKRRDTFARAVLVASLRAGGRDLADGTPPSRQRLPQREYHHLFPESLLDKKGGLESREIYCALNCALVTWNTNRHFSDKDPLTYLTERTLRSSLGEQEIRRRVMSHVIPYETLAVGGYDQGTPEEIRAKLVADYRVFLQRRAESMYKYLKSLCDGEEAPSWLSDNRQSSATGHTAS